MINITIYLIGFFVTLIVHKWLRIATRLSIVLSIVWMLTLPLIFMATIMCIVDIFTERFLKFKQKDNGNL
jgi:hypothetical protein